MKTWENATLVELDINATAQGGSDLNKPDLVWKDNETNQLYTSYSSGAKNDSDNTFDAGNFNPAN